RQAQASEGFDRRVVRMKAAMSAYVDALDAFGSAWASLDAAQGRETADLALGKVKLDDIARQPAQVAQRFRLALRQQQELEDALRPFLLRSVRDRHQVEHAGLERDMAALSSTARIPLALVDRMIHELLAAKKRTFISSGLTSACSSWEALFGASITTAAHP